MTFHCRCNIKESECSYPECISGQRDMTIEKVDKIASELQDTCHKQAQRIADLEAELDDVKQVQFPRKVEAVVAGWATKLAASQARNQQFRKVFEEYSHYAPKKEGHGLHEALALPHDTSALDAITKDAERLNFIASEYIQIDPFSIPTGGDDADVGWCLSQYYMAKPNEREIHRHYSDDLRSAIDAAMKGEQ